MRRYPDPADASPQPRDLAPPRVVGIDGWAWRRGHRYGSIVCDLEKRVIIDLLPDREMTTAMGWLLQRQASIEVVSRDRGGGYAEAAKRALPNAIQIADRRHLFANASAAFLDAVRRHMPEIRRAFGSRDLDPGLLTAVEKRQWDGCVSISVIDPFEVVEIDHDHRKRAPVADR